MPTPDYADVPAPALTALRTACMALPEVHEQQVLEPSSDWDEVGELLTESYCIMAPKKFVALVVRPPE